MRAALDRARRPVVSLAAGLLMGAVYWALDITSPAPPLIGLTGLLGIVLGERAATWGRVRLAAPHQHNRREETHHDRS
ncbi:XapX domain-containing protein [Streptomyces sp. NPDC053750]|uniref:XapX domain-containing protein n=1 Tax=Streptomyces sp. NPDC053750 TaxID=3365714 RepID=UPI0037D6E0DA